VAGARNEKKVFWVIFSGRYDISKDKNLQITNLILGILGLTLGLIGVYFSFLKVIGH
jgi:hypothetical protein